MGNTIGTMDARYHPTYIDGPERYSYTGCKPLPTPHLSKLQCETGPKRIADRSLYRHGSPNDRTSMHTQGCVFGVFSFAMMSWR